jgi:hypothetical protein
VLSRILCASQCPPHNVYHEIEQFPSRLYYNPVYFPSYHVSLFETEETVCQWLLKGLQDHILVRCSCLQLPDSFQKSECDDKVCYKSSVFHVKFHGLCLLVPLAYVECSFFSFCRLLHRQLLSLTSKLQCIPADMDQWSIHAETAVAQVPIWVMRDEEEYSVSVSVVCTSTTE